MGGGLVGDEAIGSAYAGGDCAADGNDGGMPPVVGAGAVGAGILTAAILS